MQESSLASSHALNYWGDELQKNGPDQAPRTLYRVLEVESDNIPRRSYLECNKNLQAGRESSVPVSRSVDDEFGKYRGWDQVVGENGPFDEPKFSFEQGLTFVRNNLYHQAAQQFDRGETLAPRNLLARIWLAQLYVVEPPALPSPAARG